MAFVNNLAYEASAGSGKTFMLVVRYLSLLFQGASPSKILALTFTNKAASEMQERVVSTLEELENRGELDEIVKVTELPREFLLENRQRILNEFLNSHTKIMTIDSFFTQILRKFSLYASLMPDFSTFASQHELKLLSRFLKEVTVAGKKETLVALSLSSKKRLTDIFTLLDEFYVKFSELKDMEFSKQNYLQFEEEAMLYMSELRALVESCEAASKTAIKSVEAENFYELSQKAWIARESLDYSTFKKCFTPVMDDLLLKIQEAVKNQNRAKEQNFFFGIKELVDIYAKSKKALYMDDSELSFSDVTYLVYEILNLIDDSEFLYFRLDSQIEHMLLDEFQDTSILQYEIMKPLINEITSGNGIFDNGSFFFVGDVKQSIYRFRGGVSSLFGTVQEENNTHVEKLLTNYRSQKEVIEFVNSAFIEKIKNYSPQLVRPEASGGYVEVIHNDELLQEVTTQVQRLLSNGANINEIAILCATNGDGGEVKQALNTQNIEVVTETTTKLINQRSVKAILEYLKYLYFREDIYMYNFFALISQDVKGIKRVDFNEVKIIHVVKDVIEKYELFSDDFNLIRFLNAISKYSDIEALLFEYERLDTSAAASELNGVRVLTVHKSKGLEYEHVIVMDRLKKAPPARDSIIYEYDDITLKNIYLRIKGRDAIDKQYANALTKERTLVREDSLNALYVAFTRARDNLIVIMKSKGSIFEILDLTCKKSGTLTCTNSSNISTCKEEFKALEYKNLYYGTQSDILKLEDDKEEDLKSINFGLAMHYMLEMLGEFREENIINAKDMMINKYGHSLEDEEVLDIENRAKLLLQNDKFKTLSSGECYREQAIRYKNNLRYIDLLVKSDTQESLFGSWNIIDYKSSASYSEHHLKQVRYYVKAIKEITGEDVDGYICYLLKNEIKIVSV
ncbi:RecB-like helicase [Candidatus Sulfurimonas marisnigri]|uniref:DNA 3'-5' helicase n=1 Tax=Candidatus Sulfurimonas marisnigri TaxID=2740405 RepID=A0A7S7RQF5_9BACT|nr:RecB-like helicase [Candidatus Sulfurimonas marisnigri]QOY54493.1 RecB-like helicase [Candidatus Sulfurimonas marisnigri]